jgi:hypothetical protein
MRKSDVFEWHRQFREGRGGLQVDPRSGQPKTQRTDADVDIVRTLVRSDQRLGVGLIAEELNMNNHLCGVVVRVHGYRSGGSGSIPGATSKKKKN